MLFKGIAEIEVSGVKRGLKFGTLASGYFCQEEKISLKEMMERLQNPTPITFINSIYGAAKSYNESKKLPIDFTTNDVGDWIDEVGIDKISEVMFACMQTYQEREDEKNALTPETNNPGSDGQ